MQSFHTFSEYDGVDFLCRVKQDNSAMWEASKLPMMELDKEISCAITSIQTKSDKKAMSLFKRKTTSHESKDVKKFTGTGKTPKIQQNSIPFFEGLWYDLNTPAPFP